MEIRGKRAGPSSSAQKLSLCSGTFWGRPPSQCRLCWSSCLGRTMALASVAGLCKRHWWTSFERHWELCRALLLGPLGKQMPSMEPCGFCIALQSHSGLSCISYVKNCWRPARLKAVPCRRSSCSAACYIRPDVDWYPCMAIPMQRRPQKSHRRPHPWEKVCSLGRFSWYVGIFTMPNLSGVPLGWCLYVAQEI